MRVEIIELVHTLFDGFNASGRCYLLTRILSVRERGLIGIKAMELFRLLCENVIILLDKTVTRRDTDEIRREQGTEKNGNGESDGTLPEHRI